MRHVRLLPVVIFATAALLVFKLVGLVTDGGYVLTGPALVEASSGAPEGASAGTAGATQPADAAAPGDPTLTDTAPVAVDTAPTLAAKPPTGGGEGGGHSAAPEAKASPEGHAAEAPPAPPPANAVAADVSSPSGGSAGAAPPDHTAPSGPATTADANGCPSFAEAALPATKGDAGQATATEGDGSAASLTGVKLPGNCPPPPDAIPTMVDGSGHIAPLAAENGGSPTDAQILARLGERRAELDAQAKELDMRAALLDAAQKRLDERESALKALQSKLDAEVNQGKSSEDEQFAAIVNMYETMKPADAANIFNNLDMNVLVRVASRMNPRKMAPVMAKMDPSRAQALTVQLASATAQADASGTPALQPGQLPQIVGQ